MDMPAWPQVGQTNHERRANKEEKLRARRTLVPVLQAEEDRRCARLWVRYQWLDPPTRRGEI